MFFSLHFSVIIGICVGYFFRDMFLVIMGSLRGDLGEPREQSEAILKRISDIFLTFFVDRSPGVMRLTIFVYFAIFSARRDVTWGGGEIQE